MYFVKASNRVRDVIVAMEIVGIGVERVISGGGSEEDNNGDVMDEEKSSIIIRVVGEVEARWTKISIMGGNKIGST